MPRIPYVDLASVTDPEILGYLEQAREVLGGTTTGLTPTVAQGVHDRVTKA